MKKLTKKQRHEIYKKALKLFINEKEKFLCCCIGELIARTLKVKPSYRTEYCTEEFAQELLLCAPDGNPYGWFHTNDEYTMTIRKQILMFCIEMTR